MFWIGSVVKWRGPEAETTKGSSTRRCGSTSTRQLSAGVIRRAEARNLQRVDATPNEHSQKWLCHRLLGEGHAGELFLEALAFGGVGGFGKAVGELEESAVLGFLGLQAGFDQIDENAAGAGLLVLGEGENALGDASRERNALAHGTVNGTHAPIVQRAGEAWNGA